MPAPTAHMSPIDTRYQRIIAIAVPVMLANLAMPLQSVIDTAIVGHMDDAAKLAGMGLAIQLLSLLLVSFNFLQYASSGLSAQALGQFADSHFYDSQSATNDNIITNNTKNDAAKKRLQRSSALLSILQRALVLAFIIGAILLLAKPWLIDFGLKALSANPASGLAAKTYLDVQQIARDVIRKINNGFKYKTRLNHSTTVGITLRLRYNSRYSLINMT